jgi:uncharacterized membrane protein
MFNKIQSHPLYSKLKKPEYIFAFVTLIFGLFFIAVVPPGWNSDEVGHFLRVQQIVNDGQIVASKQKMQGVEMHGGLIDTNSIRFITGYGNFTPTTGRLTNKHYLSSPLTHLHYNSTKIFTAFNPYVIYSPITYVPYIIGTFIAKVLGLSIFEGFVLSKLFGLLTYILIVGFAIRLIPKGKWILMTICLLPTTIVQVSAFSGDSFTFSTIILFISYVLYLAYNRRPLKLRQAIYLTVLLTCLGLVKPTYLSLAPLVLVLPIARKDLRDRLSMARILIPVFIAAIPAAIWFKLTSGIPPSLIAFPTILPNQQMKYVLSNPFRFARTLTVSYFGVTENGQYGHFFDFAFRNFLEDGVQFSQIYSWASIVAIVASLGIKDRLSLKIKDTIKALALNTFYVCQFIVVFLVINLALYLYGTPLKDNLVVGTQARYYLPFLLLLLLPFQNVVKNQAKQKYIVLALSMFVLLGTTVAILKFLYA